ncbi:MAG TPA: UDP-N-acetylmuramoyl-tripeptide--D-alanyl-D-alanine ligase [Thermoleophilaceae bacterium]
MTAAGFDLAFTGLLALMAGRLHVLLHLFQLEHYEPARLRVWVARRGERIDTTELGALAAFAALMVAGAAIEAEVEVIALGLLALVLGVRRGLAMLRRDQIKPLVFTPRATRMYGVSLGLLVGAALAISVAVIVGVDPLAGAIGGAVFALVAYLLAPELLLLANLMIGPVQRLDNRRYEQRARRHLAAVDPLVVGITGSYGKTTTKSCVAAVAELRGPACPTPASFNSFLGVVRAINEELEKRHRTFIAEMGAYRRGDVAELCELVSPTIGILTAIGPAHLERFGSLDETERAKGELGESLPPDGVLVTRADDERCRRAAERSPAPVRLFAPYPHPDADVWAEDVELRDGRTVFRLRTREGGDAQVKARLLGEHNVANLVAAAAAGLAMDLPLDAIARSLAKVTPPPHRLAPIVNSAAGVVVIDDAYNSNPEGAAAALEVLASHPAERRLLVTPGMVELGAREEEENRRFGERAAGVCDLVVLVGPEQTRPIRAGLESAGFAADALHVVADAGEAQALLARTTRRGDVVLFENDLPDLYRAGGANGAGS